MSFVFGGGLVEAVFGCGRSEEVAVADVETAAA